ncbi:MAG: site-specific integrase [Gammaproteobacteria bacterium]|nr:site-specific integrase [Gammaproteobacteria bacterium]MCY4338834.1 site-specific integrase [Gammaproteobacteria bacterium]
MMQNQNNQSVHGEILSLALSENTRIAYSKGWRCFQDYCVSRSIEPLNATPDDVTNFFIYLSSVPRSVTATIKPGEPLSMGTLSLYKSAINKQYNQVEKMSPTHAPKVNAIRKGLSRTRGDVPRQVQALREHHIKKMLKHCGNTLIGLRDAAILAVGFAGALRRSELCSLTVDDIEIISPVNGCGSRKMFMTIRKSKTDHAGKGQRIAIPEGKQVKPIHRLQAWMDAAGITHGYLFQTMRRGGVIRGNPLHHSDIPRLIKRYAEAIGLNPKEVSGHSLRAGFVTCAAAHHARLDKIMDITRHTNPATVMKYIRDADSFHDHAGEKFL